MKLLFILFNLIMGLLSLPLFIFAIVMFQGLSLFVTTTPIYHKILAIIVILLYLVMGFFINRFIYRKININLILYIVAAVVIYVMSAIFAFMIFYKLN